MSDRQRLHELLNQLCEDSISDADFRELEMMLAETPQARRGYLEYLLLHGELLWNQGNGDTIPLAGIQTATAGGGRSSLSDTTRRALARVRRFFAQPTPLSMTVAALVIGLFITAMAFIAAPIYTRLAHAPANDNQEIEVPTHVAQLTGVYDATWAKASSNFTVGSYLKSGNRLRLRAGVASVTFENGTHVVLEGPVDFVVESLTSSKLRQGRMFARVPPAGRGFLVETPRAKVWDLGTEFGIDVSDAGDTHVSVVRGTVELQLAANDNAAPKRVLTAGMAIDINAEGRSRNVAANKLKFYRDVPQPSSTVLSFAITDPQPADRSPMQQEYGDRVTGAADKRDANIYYYFGENEFTPAISVEYSAGNGGRYLYWGTGDWAGGVGYLRCDGNVATHRPFYDTTFTPDAGSGVRVKQFVLDDWNGDGQGHVVSWQLYARAAEPANLIASGADVAIASNERRTIETGMREFCAEALILRIEHTDGKQDHLAVDDIQFEQAPARVRRESN